MPRWVQWVAVAPGPEALHARGESASLPCRWPTAPASYSTRPIDRIRSRLRDVSVHCKCNQVHRWRTKSPTTAASSVLASAAVHSPRRLRHRVRPWSIRHRTAKFEWESDTLRAIAHARSNFQARTLRGGEFGGHGLRLARPTVAVWVNQKRVQHRHNSLRVVVQSAASVPR